MKPLGIEGAWTEERKVFSDDRGSFRAWYQANTFAPVAGTDFDLRQANCVVSSKGVLRGIHYTADPPGQAKYFHCVRGSALGAVVDVRIGSPTFGEWRTVELNDDNCAVLYVAEGLGSGFMALDDDTVLIYLSSADYDPSVDHGLHPLDSAVGIQWPAGITAELSDRDAGAPSLAEAERLGLLPHHKG